MLALLGISLLLGACGSDPKPRPKPALHPVPLRPPASAKPPPPKPATPTTLGPIGTSHPIVLEAIAADGGWAVFCQARSDSDGNGRIEVRIGPHGAPEGDVLQRYLTLDGGEGTPIEEYLTSDPTGHFLIIRRGGHAILIDAHSRAELDLSLLGADTRSELALFRRHRAFAFDGLGRRLIYLRRTDSGTRALVRELSDGHEVTVESPAPDVYRVELDYSGNYALLHALIDDTNRDGRLTWPSPEAKSPPACSGPIANYPAWYGRGDTPVVEVSVASGGTAHATPGFVSVLGDDLVIREPTGRLVLEQKGTRVELAPAKCRARVVHTDAERKLLLIACTGPIGRPKLELVGAGYRQELQIDLGAWTDDRPAGAATRLVALYPGNETTLLDLEQKRLFPLEAGDRVAAIWQSRALLRRKRELILFDATTVEQRALPAATLPLAEVVVKQQVTVVAPLVIDLAEARVVGRIDGRPLAALADGRVLIADGGSSDGTRLAVGPLVWRSPTAIELGH